MHQCNTRVYTEPNIEGYSGPCQTSKTEPFVKIVKKLHLAGPILDIESMGACFRAHFQKKGHFVCLHPLKQISFLTISNGIIFFKTQGTRLGAIVAPNKGLE